MAGKSSSFINDLWVAGGEHLFWYNFAIFDVSNKYKRTILGPFWNSLTCLIIVLILTTIWAIIFKQPYSDFLPKMSIGYTVWWYINSIVAGSCTLYTGKNRTIITDSTVSLISISFRHVLSNLIFFIHDFLSVVVILLIIGFDFNLMILTLPLGVMLITFIAIPVSLILGIICARYSDLEVLINNIMAVGIMISPVMWDLTVLGDLWKYAYLNPFTPFLEICKSSTLGVWPNIINYQAILVLSVLCWTFAAFIYQKYKARLVYWL